MAPGGIKITEKLTSKFELGKLLGEGSFGAVYEAKDKANGARVAIKFLAGGDKETEERFITEAKLAASVKHQNIVSVIDWGNQDGQLYIVYEFVDGPSLREAMDKERISTQRVKKLICDIAKALAVLHKNAIVHRDVKPENIIIGKDGVPKLTDLGIAKSLLGLGVKTKTGVIVGTPQYMAPEIIRGEKPSGSADVYSLGVILYELLTGKCPFSGEIKDLMVSHLHSKVPNLPAGIPRQLGRVAQTMLRKKLQERPSIDDIIEKLSGKLSQSSVIRTQLVRQSTDALPSPAPPQKKPSRVPLVALVILIILSVTTICFLGPFNSSQMDGQYPLWKAEEEDIMAVAVKLSAPTGRLTSKDKQWLREVSAHTVRLSRKTIETLAEATFRAGIGDKEMLPVRCLLALSCCFLSNELTDDPRALGKLAIKLIEPFGKFKQFKDGESPLLSAARLAILDNEAPRYVRNDFAVSHKRGLISQLNNALTLLEDGGGKYSTAEKWLVLANLIKFRVNMEDGNHKKLKSYLERLYRNYAQIAKDPKKELSLFTRVLLRLNLEIHLGKGRLREIVARGKVELKDDFNDNEVSSSLSMFRYLLLMHKSALSKGQWESAEKYLQLARETIENTKEERMSVVADYQEVLTLEDKHSDLRDRKDIETLSEKHIEILTRMMKKESCWSVDLRYKRAVARLRLINNNRKHEFFPLIKEDLHYVVDHSADAYNPKVPERARTWLITLRLPGKIDPSIFDEAGKYQSKDLKKRFEKGLKK